MTPFGMLNITTARGAASRMRTRRQALTKRLLIKVLAQDSALDSRLLSW